MKHFIRLLSNIPVAIGIALIFIACTKNLEPTTEYLREKDAIIQDDSIEEAKEIEESANDSDFSAETVEAFHKVTFEKVVDGDTLIVSDEAGNIKIRMIGIDTPESVHSDERKNSEYGVYASDYLKELLADTTTLYLQHDEGLTDSYDRVLAYVWLKEDVDVTSVEDVKQYMLNAKIAEAGMARVMTIEPNTTYADIFSDLVAEAQSQGKGNYALATEDEIYNRINE